MKETLESAVAQMPATIAQGAPAMVGRIVEAMQLALARDAQLPNMSYCSLLMKLGANAFGESGAAGIANIGTAGTGGRGTVTTGALEMSNVDLATQFTGMITAERGFQANGRVITTSDEMLQELVNLKR